MNHLRKSTHIDLRYMGSAIRYTQVRPRSQRGWRRLLPRMDKRRVA